MAASVEWFGSIAVAMLCSTYVTESVTSVDGGRDEDDDWQKSETYPDTHAALCCMGLKEGTGLQGDENPVWNRTFGQDYWVFWTFPSSGILETRKHDVSENGSVSVLR
jgi:hypothetical protein